MSALDLLVNGGVTAVLPRRPVPRDRPLARWRHEHVAGLRGCRRLGRTVARWAVGGGHRRWDDDRRLPGRRRARLPARVSARPAATGRRRAGPLVLGQPVRPTRRRRGRALRARRPSPRAHLVDLVPPGVHRRRRAAPGLRPQPPDRDGSRLGHRQGPERGVARRHDAARWLQGARPSGRDPRLGPAPHRASWMDLRPGCSTPLPISTSSRPVVWPAACGLRPPARSAPMASSRACGWSRPSWLRPAWPARMCSSRPSIPAGEVGVTVASHQGRPAADGAIGDWLNTAGYELAGRAASAHAGEIALVPVDDVRQALAWLCGRTQQPETCAVAHAAAAVPLDAARPYGSPSIPERVAAQRPA